MIRTWLVCQYTLLALEVAHAHSASYTQNLPGLSLPKQHDVKCNEKAQPCDVEYKISNNTLHELSVPEHVGIGFIDVQILVKLTSPSVCMLDPLKTVASRLGEVTDITELFLNITCSRADIRVILQPKDNHTSSVVYVALSINNCTAYWKDIGLLGRFVDIRYLYIINSRDEFERNATEYVHQCVSLCRIPTSLVEKTLESFHNMTYICGLANVGGLAVHSNIIRTVSPAFTHHVWPMMAEIYFHG